MTSVRYLGRVAASRALGPSLLIACLLAAAPACSSNDDAQPSPSGEDAGGTNEKDAAAVDSGSGPARSTCEDRGAFVTVDGGESPWTEAEPLDGEACSSVGAKWRDACQCGKRCDCTASGWVCAFLAC